MPDDRGLERQLTDERFLEADLPDTTQKPPDASISVKGSKFRHFLRADVVHDTTQVVLVLARGRRST